MPPVLKVLKAYLILAGITVAGLVAWRIAAAYSWERLAEGDETMVPTLRAGQIFRVDRTVGLEGLRRGSLVAYVKDPAHPDTVSVGRVVALPGERVAIVKGQVQVNGEPLSDVLSDKPTDVEIPDLLVPRGQLFLLADCRSGWQFQADLRGDMDSRAFGPVSAGRLLGRVVL